MASEADLKMEIAISRMLRAGVSLAAFVVLVGGILYLWQAHGIRSGLSSFSRNSSPADRVAPLFDGIRHLDSRSIIRLGILLLIATPIVRVAYCVFGFAAQKDKIYVLVSSIVLCLALQLFSAAEVDKTLISSPVWTVEWVCYVRVHVAARLTSAL